MERGLDSWSWRLGREDVERGPLALLGVEGELTGGGVCCCNVRGARDPQQTLNVEPGLGTTNPWEPCTHQAPLVVPIGPYSTGFGCFVVSKSEGTKM